MADVQGPGDELRHVEKEVLIPKKMREKARDEKCVEEVKAFSECCKSSSFAMVLKCRPENAALKQCMTRWYKDPEFFDQCKQEYLAEREEFRKTGKTQKQRRLEGALS
ncbi:COX assembly mitochondrial protein homolog [Ptychodera flava]|uniref:COX assembly mitochondrial protein homolog n=1 Tax=Ptychodera flava TaxID=63121 RepID=UPI00396A83CF